MKYVMSSKSLLELFAVVALVQLPLLQADASSAESAERYVAKAFDGLCVQNAENLGVIDSIAKTNGWPAVDSEKLAAVSFGQKGLRGYAWKRDGVVYLVGINPDGACSVTAQSINPQEVKKLCPGCFDSTN